MFDKTISEGTMKFDDFLKILDDNKDAVGKVKIKKTKLLYRKKIVDSENSLGSIAPIIKEEFSPSEKYEPYVKYRLSMKKDGTRVHEFMLEYLTKSGVDLHDEKTGETIGLRELQKTGIVRYSDEN